MVCNHGIFLIDDHKNISNVLHDPYIMGETDTYKKLYRLTGITRADDMVRNITGCEYIPELYSDNDSYVIETPIWEPRKATALQTSIHEFLSYKNGRIGV